MERAARRTVTAFRHFAYWGHASNVAIKIALRRKRVSLRAVKGTTSAALANASPELVLSQKFITR